MRPLAGHPLIAYTIAAAQESGVFHRVCIATDDPEVRKLTPWDGKTFFCDRKAASDDQPDIEWVREYLATHSLDDSFAILRPTSPFRTAGTIRRAYEQFKALPERADSLRAMEPVKQHPGKMWVIAPHGQALPLIDQQLLGVPLHSRPTQSLPPIHVQNASLEMAKRRVIDDWTPSISGRVIYPFLTEGYEGFDINTEEDFQRAEMLAEAHPELLPRIEAHVR